ncbi:galactosylceramide sulfotransferase-like [Glandiceps talaboti]
MTYSGKETEDFIGKDNENYEKCQPQNNIVFIKTAKTGGSTLSTIIYRYGLKHDLVAAVDPNHNALIQEDESAEHYVIEKYNCSDFPGYNIMASHIYYNRPAMEEIVDNAKYVTIIRFPQSRIKSGFYYMEKDELFPNASNPLGEYLELRYGKFLKQGADVAHGFKENFRRFRLSIEEGSLQTEFQRLDKEIDLVMLTEYFDESLILLKKLLCWDFEDIVYVRMKVQETQHPPVTPRMIDMIKDMSKIDNQFYEYFNNTFWEKVKTYEGNFSADLKEFRTLQEDVGTRCTHGNESSFCERLRGDAIEMLRRSSAKNSRKWNCY